MKNTFRFLLLLPLFITACKDDNPPEGNGDTTCDVLVAPPEATGWSVEQRTSGTGFTLTDHFFHALDADSLLGFNAGVIRSNDGGQQWQLLPGYPASLQGNAVSFHLAPDNTVYVLYNSTDPASPGQFLVVGANLGQSFSKRVVTHDGTLVKLAFKDALNGFALEYRPGGFGVVKTSDGGLTWSDVSGADFTETNTYYRLEFKTPAFGYAFLGQSNFAYVTVDGGANWQKITAGALSGNTTFFFRDPNLVFAYDSNKTMRSTDGGLTWQSVADYPVGVLTMKGDRGIAVVRDPNCAALGNAWAFATTEDAGLTWARTKHSSAVQVNSFQEIAPGQAIFYNATPAPNFINLTLN